MRERDYEAIHERRQHQDPPERRESILFDPGEMDRAARINQ